MLGLLIGVAALTTEVLADDQEVAALIKRLGSTNVAERVQAAQTLGHLGKKALPGVEALIVCLTDTAHTQERHFGSSRIVEIDGVTYTEMSFVDTGRAEPVSSYAARALVSIGDKSAIPYLEDALTHENARIRLAAARALAEFSNAGSAPALVRALSDKNDQVIWASVEGLCRIKQVPKEATSRLTELLMIETPTVNWNFRGETVAGGRLLMLCDALVHTPEGTIRMIEQALRLKRDVSCAPFLRYVLIQSGQKSDDHLPDLIKALQEGDKDHIFAAMIILGRMGKQAMPAVPELIRLLSFSYDKTQEKDAFWGWKNAIPEEASLSLARITGMSYGVDQAKWLHWWQNANVKTQKGR